MKPVTARVDAVLAALFAAAAAALIVLSNQAVTEAERLYGNNPDFRAIALVVAIAYLVPVALGFALAALAGWRAWRLHKALHWLALCAALGPIAFCTWWLWRL